MNIKKQLIIMDSSRCSICLKGQNIHHKLGLGILSNGNKEEVSIYLCDFQDSGIHLQPDPQMAKSNQFITILYQDVEFVQYSLASRTQLSAPLPLFHTYYLIDLIIVTKDFEVHLDLSINSPMLFEVFDFIKAQQINISDPYGLQSIINQEEHYKEDLQKYGHDHFEKLSKLFRLDIKEHNSSIQTVRLKACQ